MLNPRREDPFLIDPGIFGIAQPRVLWVEDTRYLLNVVVLSLRQVQNEIYKTLKVSVECITRPLNLLLESAQKEAKLG